MFIHGGQRKATTDFQTQRGGALLANKQYRVGFVWFGNTVIEGL